MTLLREQQSSLRKFTYRDLLELERAGILGEDERVELLHGNIIAMTPANPPHALVVDELHERFVEVLGKRARVRSQNPLRLSRDLNDAQLPIPDVLLLERRDYTDHPLPEDVFLLVEVSDSTLVKDRRVKLPLYAGVGIPEVWIVNLLDQQIEVYTTPRHQDYLARNSYALTATFAPSHFPDLAHQWLPERVLELLG